MSSETFPYRTQARALVGAWYADGRHSTQMTGYALELLVEAVDKALPPVPPSGADVVKEGGEGRRDWLEEKSDWPTCDSCRMPARFLHVASGINKCHAHAHGPEYPGWVDRLKHFQPAAPAKWCDHHACGFDSADPDIRAVRCKQPASAAAGECKNWVADQSGWRCRDCGGCGHGLNDHPSGAKCFHPDCSCGVFSSLHERPPAPATAREARRVHIEKDGRVTEHVPDHWVCKGVPQFIELTPAVEAALAFFAKWGPAREECQYFNVHSGWTSCPGQHRETPVGHRRILILDTPKGEA